jgi:hypothetical protein
VLQLYEESGASDLRERRRFNGAIDQTLIESMGRFAVHTDLFRDPMASQRNVSDGKCAVCSSIVFATVSRRCAWR